MCLNYNKSKNYLLKFKRTEKGTKNSCSRSHILVFSRLSNDFSGVFLVLHNGKVTYFIVFALQSLIFVVFFVLIFSKIACYFRFWFSVLRFAALPSVPCLVPVPLNSHYITSLLTSVQCVQLILVSTPPK